MTTVIIKENFKKKAGYWRTVMSEKYGKDSDVIKVRISMCYPATEEGKFVEYVQNTYETTRADANKRFLKAKAKDAEMTIKK